MSKTPIVSIVLFLFAAAFATSAGAELIQQAPVILQRERQLHLSVVPARKKADEPDGEQRQQ